MLVLYQTIVYCSNRFVTDKAVHSLSNISCMSGVVVAVSRTIVSLYYGEKLAQINWIKRKSVHQIVVVEEI